MNLKPMYDKVVVQQAEADERTPGGLIMPDSTKEKPKRGTVVEVGPGLLLQDGSLAEMPLQVGDEVLFTPYGGNEVEINNEKFLIMSANEVLAKICS